MQRLNYSSRAARLITAALALALCSCVTTQGPPTQVLAQQVANAVGTALANTVSSAQVPATERASAGGSSLNPSGGVGQAPPGSASSGKMVVINGVNIIIGGRGPNEERWRGKKIEETPLGGFFAKRPLDQPGVYWPRVAIRIADYSETLLTESSANYLIQPSQSMPSRARPLECLKFSAVIWTDARKATPVDNVVLCSSDIKEGESHYSLGALRTYRNLLAPVSASSMQVRSMGPKIPNDLLPNSTSDEIQLYGNGQHLFSALFMKMGYRGPLDDDPRLWFLNTSAKR